MILTKQSLLKPLMKITPITERRAIMPILSNVLITFLEHKINLFATDLEISMIVEIPHENDTYQKACVHARSLLDIIKSLNVGDINIGIEGNTMKIEQGKSKFKLPLMDAEEFPEPQTFESKTKIVIQSNLLRSMVDKIEYAISIDETRIALTGVYIEVDENGNMAMAGTDGFRFSLIKHHDPSLMFADAKIIIPKKGVQEIVKLEGEIAVSIGERLIEVQGGDTSLTIRLIEAAYPDYNNVIPEDVIEAVVKREELQKALQQIQTVDKGGTVTMSLHDNICDMRAEGIYGEAETSLPVQYSDVPKELFVNIKYLTESISKLEQENIILGLSQTYGPIKIQEGNYTSIIMPIRR